jgi:hypothetical protein
MLTTTDNKKGLVKTTWAAVRNRVKKVEPEFFKLVDEISPDNTFPVFLAYFPYGALKGDTISSFMPLEQGGHYRLSDKNAPKEVQKHLGYGIGSSPFGMILEKNFEYFIDLKHRSVSKPWKIGTPGTIFPIDRLFKKRCSRIYSPNGVLSVSSGARSVFMLPSISRDLNHSYLQRDFNISTDAPTTLYEHWETFREIANSPFVNSNWRSCLLYFSEKWLNKLMNDSKWEKLKTYLYEKAWGESEYYRSAFYYDVIFSEIKTKRNLKLNPYLSDTARHLFAIMLGDAVGYMPQIDEASLPLYDIQKAYIESYALKNYWPTIMGPGTFSLEKSKNPIYYSLQNATTLESSPKSSLAASTLSELRDLERIMRVYKQEISDENSLCIDTILCKAANSVKLSYYHNKPDRHHVVNKTEELLKNNVDLSNMKPEFKLKNATFAYDARFIRGCVEIKK